MSMQYIALRLFRNEIPNAKLCDIRLELRLSPFSIIEALLIHKRGLGLIFNFQNPSRFILTSINLFTVFFYYLNEVGG